MKSIVIILSIATYNTCLMISKNISAIKQMFLIKLALYLGFAGGIVILIRHIINIINNGFGWYIIKCVNLKLKDF